MYTVILIVNVLLLFAAIAVYRAEILSPAVMLLLYSLLAVLVGYYKYDSWDIKGYSLMGAVVYCLGIGAFTVGAFIPRVLSSPKKTIALPIGKTRIDVPGYAVILCVAVSIVVTGYRIRGFLQTSGNLSAISLGYAIQYARVVSSEENLYDPEIINLLSYFRAASSIMLVGVYIYNWMHKKCKHGDYKYLLPIIPYLVDSFIRSSRGEIIQIAISIVTLWYIILKKTKGWVSKYDYQFMKKLVVIAAIAVPLFVLSAVATGRYTNISDMDVGNYVSVYVSGGVRALDLYVKANPKPNPTIWGEETFVNLHNFIYAFTGNPTRLKRFLEFEYIKGITVGNIYTSFRRFFHDFGITGVVTLSFLQGLVSGLVYALIKRRNNNGLQFFELFYAFFAYTIIYIVIDELYYTSLFSFVGLKRIVMFCLAYVFLLKNRIRFVIRNN